MKAARRLNSGTGDEEKGWKRSSSLSLSDDWVLGPRLGFELKAVASASLLGFDVNLREWPVLSIVVVV
uniref:hypothetical protein n=1 Tax=Streptobacillus moniliformis TaxID=34105 RepID=UPI001E5E2BA8